MKSFFLSDVGKVRDHNEDNVIIIKNKSDEYLLAVADGMGGHSAGEVASSLAVDYLMNSFNENFNNLNKVEAINWLREKVVRINELIFDYVAKHPESRGMGTTLVTAIVTKNYILFGNIGDSSGFVVKNEKLHKVTYDHTLVNLLVKNGELTEEEAKNHPRKNVLMKALGATNAVDMDIFDIETEVDQVLLCSDGLTNMLTFEQINKVLNEDLSIENKLQKLIYKCNNRGGNDNISIAYLIKEGASK